MLGGMKEVGKKARGGRHRRFVKSATGKIPRRAFAAGGPNGCQRLPDVQNKINTDFGGKGVGVELRVYFH